MKKYVKEFIKRGLMFGGFGPIVLGLVAVIIELTGTKFELEAWQLLLAIVSTYLLGFIQAGSSVFEQIEEWSTFKSALIHLITIYLIYLATYLINSWIPFNWLVVLIFSISVILGFLLIWFICYLASNKTKKKLNSLL